MEETKKNTSKKKIVLGVVIVVLLIAVFAGIYFLFGPKTTEGSKSYTLEVVDDAGNTKDYKASTDAEYLRDALEELEESEDFSMEGDEDDYGLYIDTINGVRQNGVDSQPVHDGDAFKLVYETYNE